MKQEHSMKSFRWLREKIKAYPWLVLLVVNLGLYLLPQTYRVIRTFQVVSVLVLWVLGIHVLRRRRPIAIAILSVGIAVVVFLCLPGSDPDKDRLRKAYVRSLERYEGTRYVWGGENRIGIDCSGLVRNGLINANLRVGISTLNPKPIRRAFAMWWHDCSARALLEGYRQLTVSLFEADSINSIADSSLVAGDIAVTVNGVHVLAYLGEGRWIEADPGPMRTIIVQPPSDNTWFNVPVHVLRWSQLAEANPPVATETAVTPFRKLSRRSMPFRRLDLRLKNEVLDFPEGLGDADHAARVANLLALKGYEKEPFLGKDFNEEKDAKDTTFWAIVGFRGNDLSATVTFAEEKHPRATLRVLTSRTDRTGPSETTIQTNRRGE